MSDLDALKLAVTFNVVATVFLTIAVILLLLLVSSGRRK